MHYRQNGYRVLPVQPSSSCTSHVNMMVRHQSGKKKKNKLTNMSILVLNKSLYCVVWGGKKHRFAYQICHVAPCQFKGAIDVSSLRSDVLKELDERGGSWEIKGQSFIDCLGVGGVLNDTQHSGFLSSALYLYHNRR